MRVILKVPLKENGIFANYNNNNNCLYLQRVHTFSIHISNLP